MSVDLPRTARGKRCSRLVIAGTLLAIAITYLFTGDLVMHLGVMPATPLVAAIISTSASVIIGLRDLLDRARHGRARADLARRSCWSLGLQFVVICMQTRATGRVSAAAAAGRCWLTSRRSVISIWLLTNFIAELHGFKSLDPRLPDDAGFAVRAGVRRVADPCDDRHLGSRSAIVMYDVHEIRKDFPILSRQVNGKPLVYLDNGASAQKPQVVIDAVTHAYSHEYSNVHRGLHYLSNLATEKYEAVRGTIARFLNAGSEDEIVMNTGTTEGINMVAYGWAMPRMEAGDEIVLSVHGASRQHRALAFPARTAGREAGLGRHRRRRRRSIRRRCWTRSRRRPSWWRSRICRTCWAPGSM